MSHHHIGSRDASPGAGKVDAHEEIQDALDIFQFPGYDQAI
jgi:hypothetical protein